MNEIKKLIAAQGVQDFQINDPYNSYAKQNYDYHSRYEEEKRNREQVSAPMRNSMQSEGDC